MPPDIAPADLPKVTLDLTQPAVDAGTLRETTTHYARLVSREQCGSAPQGGWFYDRNDNPTRIVACDNLCKAIRSPGVVVSIGGGCSAPPPTP